LLEINPKPRLVEVEGFEGVPVLYLSFPTFSPFLFSSFKAFMFETIAGELPFAKP